MSAKLINLNPDLKRLRDKGYEVEVKSNYLILHSVPYVTSKSEIGYGMLITDLTRNGDQVVKPKDHQVWFAGETPCNKDGSPIEGLGARNDARVLFEDVSVNFRFSSKPKDGYADYYEKLTTYIDILLHPAQALNDQVTARTHKPVPETEEDSVFLYTDSASSRAGITAVSDQLAMDKIGIVGLGGTGSYILDLVSKTPAREIHLFDGDVFLDHNAFRAPGAVPLETLRRRPSKVSYYVDIYSQMRRGLVPHECYIDDQNLVSLRGLDFVFISVDKPAARSIIAEFLIREAVPFVDVGMELEFAGQSISLVGTCRTTLCSENKSAHFNRHVSTDGSPVDDLYESNIQVADMNALNAAMAVIKWKKYCGFYQDCYQEHQSAYVINAHQLTRDETGEDTA